MAEIKISELTEATTTGDTDLIPIVQGGVTKYAKKSNLVATSGGGTWGSITGTLSDQTDLNTALGLKASQSSLNTHTTDVSNPHSVTKSQVGLGNVDNTSDVNKPVSTAQSAAIALKEPAITAGTTAQYLKGDKSLGTFITDVLGVVLTGLSLATGTAIVATDTVLVAFGKLQKQLTDLTTTVSGKEASITAGTTSQYWRGDKSFVDFYTDVRAATLTGLSTATNAVITTSDTVLSALGKLQKQITDLTATVTGKLDKSITTVSKTASFTVDPADAYKTYEINSASAIVVTVNNGLTAGMWWRFKKIGAGSVTFTAGTSSISAPDSRGKIRAVNSYAFLEANTSSTTSLSGDIVI